MGGFYERLTEITKRFLRKSIGKLSLTSSQLQIVLSEVEAIVNTRPLNYEDNKLKPRKIIHTNAFPIRESKNWLTSNCKRP